MGLVEEIVSVIVISLVHLVWEVVKVIVKDAAVAVQVVEEVAVVVVAILVLADKPRRKISGIVNQ